MADDPVDLLESSRISWRRDWDAVAVGVVVGALGDLALRHAGLPDWAIVLLMGGLIAGWIGLAIRMTEV